MKTTKIPQRIEEIRKRLRLDKNPEYKFITVVTNGIDIVHKIPVYKNPPVIGKIYKTYLKSL